MGNVNRESVDDVLNGGGITNAEQRLAALDLAGFKKELEALRQEAEASEGIEDFLHLKKIEGWGRLCAFLGWITAWIVPNPITAFLIAQGKTTRWAIIAHHVMHKGFDRIEGVPKRYTSRGFARGWRRFLDWFDWIDPQAWDKEHNALHHYRLGERFDPDVVEYNTQRMRSSTLPRWAKMLLLIPVSMTWKFTYYAPSTMKQLFTPKKSAQNESEHDRLEVNDPVFFPWTRPGRALWMRSLLPYGLWHFLLLPGCFYLINPWAGFAVLINVIMAELITNFYTFCIITPNHAGDDLYCFEQGVHSKEEFYLRQIVGSVNYKTGSDFNDFLHGWLNYQIEHHVWPDLSMRQYQQLQPKLKALCERYGIPYVQESIWQRLRQLVNISIGKTSMKLMPAVS